LTVVAFIAILAALAIPTLEKVFERGDQTRCAGNLRQLPTGYLMNAGDNGGPAWPFRHGSVILMSFFDKPR
jgi:hypothetical protein